MDSGAGGIKWHRKSHLGVLGQAGGNGGLDHGSGSTEGKDELFYIYLSDKINKASGFTLKKNNFVSPLYASSI